MRQIQRCSMRLPLLRCKLLSRAQYPLLQRQRLLTVAAPSCWQRSQPQRLPGPVQLRLRLHSQPSAASSPLQTQLQQRRRRHQRQVRFRLGTACYGAGLPPAALQQCTSRTKLLHRLALLRLGCCRLAPLQRCCRRRKPCPGLRAHFSLGLLCITLRLRCRPHSAAQCSAAPCSGTAWRLACAQRLRAPSLALRSACRTGLCLLYLEFRPQLHRPQLHRQQLHRPLPTLLLGLRRLRLFLLLRVRTALAMLRTSALLPPPQQYLQPQLAAAAHRRSGWQH